VTTLAIVLLILGAALLVAEAHVPSFGVLGSGGVLALAAGAFLLLSGVGGGLIAAVIVAALTAAVAVGVLLLAAPHLRASRRRRVRAGREAMVGHVGIIRSLGPPEEIFVDGALWRAQPADRGEEHEELRQGDRVVVEGVSGLTLSVRKAEDWEVQQ